MDIVQTLDKQKAQSIAMDMISFAEWSQVTIETSDFIVYMEVGEDKLATAKALMNLLSNGAYDSVEESSWDIETDEPTAWDVNFSVDYSKVLA